MTIKQVDVSVWYDAFVKGDYQITSAYQERTIDPDNFYALVIKSGGPINTTAYSNPEVDALIDKAAASTTMQRARQLYTQIRDIVRTEAPIIFAHYETINYLMQNNVVGSTVSPTLELQPQGRRLLGVAERLHNPAVSRPRSPSTPVVGGDLGIRAGAVRRPTCGRGAGRSRWRWPCSSSRSGGRAPTRPPGTSPVPAGSGRGPT